MAKNLYDLIIFFAQIPEARLFKGIHLLMFQCRNFNEERDIDKIFALNQ